MRFRELTLKNEYRSFTDDLINNFYIPLLDKAVLYQRAVGFFSSTALIEISSGISKFLGNNGKIHLIASPHLQEADVIAIEKGYEERNKVVERVLLNSILEPNSYFEEQRLNLLANLIAQNQLDIKIALLVNEGILGMYHEKIGLIHDNYGDIVAFSGSLNETKTAFSHNYETIDVFCSWTRDSERVDLKLKAFNSLWDNDMYKLDVIEFPKVAKQKLLSYKQTYIDPDIEKKEYLLSKENPPLYNIGGLSTSEIVGPRPPVEFQFHGYQEDAIVQWQKQNFVGIFDMATGTGKTYTGLGAICRLAKSLNNELAVVIVCPYQHLVEQWVEDIEKFSIRPIIGYSNSAQRDWKQRLTNAIRDHKVRVNDRRFFCFICTNATFASEFVQTQIGKIRGDALLVVDEAHNFGSVRLGSMLSSKFNYRLALSATLERHKDDEGTNRLKEYFGHKCIEYSLERAIDEKKLTPYKYFPVIVNLDDSELEAYTWLSQEINKCIIIDKRGKKKLNEKGERLALKRARVVAAAKSKVEKLKQLISPYSHESYILVYCGAASILSENDEYNNSVDEGDIRQIDAVTHMLGNELNMKVSQFTSRESVEEREMLKRQFEQGENIQALIAIKCLDEGVNIPKIKTAFILASTTNPKEYIQRRGRVLRLAKGKDYAEIFDFLTLPRPLDEVSSLTFEDMKRDLSLVRSEISRAEEFARIAMNSMEAEYVIQSIKDSYYLNEDNMEVL